MNGDGAHLGVGADRALETILGGKESPAEDEQMNADTFRKWILSADRQDTYGEAARLCARYLLEYLTAHPEDIRLPLDDVYDYAFVRTDFADDYPPLGEWAPYRTQEGMWEKAAAQNPALKQMDLTGFMVGWAFNAARRCIELPPAPNPALLTVDVESEP